MSFGERVSGAKWQGSLRSWQSQAGLCPAVPGIPWVSIIRVLLGMVALASPELSSLSRRGRSQKQWLALLPSPALRWVALGM